MRLYNKHISLLLSLCALSACSEDDVIKEEPIVPDSEKSPIELSVGGVDTPASATRAVVTDGTTNTTFGRDTKIFLLIQSDKDATTHDGYEYKGDRATTLYTVARANVVHATNPTAIVFDDANKKYWDDAHARSSQLTIWAFAQRIATDNDRAWPTYSFQTYNGVTPSMEESSKNDFNSTQGYNFQSATPYYPAIFTWSVGNGSANQDANTLIYQDLFFSNNIANYVGNTKVPEGSRTDNRMKFNFETRKFPASTEMKFYHAMSKITIQLKAGKGFKADGSDFKLKKNSAGNMTLDLLHGFNTRGLFNIKDGEFQLIHNSDDITTIPLTKTEFGKTNPYYTLEALAIPNIHEFMASHEGADTHSRFVDGSSEVMMEITVDDNTYKITSKNLYEALMTRDGSGNITTTPVTNATRKTDNGNYVPLEAGKNYVFTFTIGKQEIDNLTAHVAEWEDVVAEEQHPTNARITLNVEDRSGISSTSAVTSNMDIYRALDEASSITDTYESFKWTTGYTTNGKATWNNTALSYNSGENHWSTDWFWESNKTYYHFRTLSPTTQVVTPNASGDYTTIHSASCTSEAGYNQMAWGAPFLDVDPSYKFTYSTTKGFDGTGAEATTPTHQIYKAIGPTKDQIKVLMFHMFSGVHFTIKTTGSADTNTDKVELYDGTNRTKVELVGYYPDGKVLLGTGLVNADGTISTESSPYNIPFASATDAAHYVNQEYFFSAIPQDLTDVVLVITTPDHNQYKVKLWDPDHPITASVTNNNIAIPYEASSTAGKYKINRWYPGFKYNYSFTLAKTGITNLEATIVDWEKVEAQDETVVIQ